VFDFGTLELNENDGLPGAEKIVQHAEYFQVEFFDLITLEDCERIALHAGTNLAEGKKFVRLLSSDGQRRETQGGWQREKGSEKQAARLQQMTPGREHELIIIPGEARGSNQTAIWR
jgi:hypothetical protein